MTEQSIAESAPCPSKTGRGIPPTGEKSAAPSSTGPAIVAKVAPPIPIVAPATANLTPSPAASSCSPSPTLTTRPKTARRKTSAPGASDAMSPMIENTIPELEEKPAHSPATTGSRRCSNGAIELLRLDAYKPAMDALKAYLVIHGSSSPNLYRTRNKQVLAACQIASASDATPRQILAVATCYQKMEEAILFGLEHQLDKEDIKRLINEAIESAAHFFGLGNKASQKQKGRKTK